jgi:surface-anchored protein
VLGLAAVTATAIAVPPAGDFRFTQPKQRRPAVFTCDPCPDSATIEWAIDSGGFQPGVHELTTSFDTAGSHSVTLRLTSGDESTSTIKTFTVEAPTVTFNVTPASPLAGQLTNFQSQVSDPAPDTVSYAWDFGDGVTGTGASPSHAYSAAGPYTVSVTTTDSYGATASASKSIVVQADPGPTASFTFAPAIPDVGEAVAFTSTASASQGLIEQVEWDLDANNAFDDSPTNWAFSTPGTHEVRMRARQTNGKEAVGTASVRVNGLPSADFTWTPAGPVAGASVDLVSTSTDFEGPPLLSWDLNGDGLFGDGSQARFRQPFPRAGTYDIGLQVTDSDGERSTVRKKLVVAAAPTPSGPTSPSATPRPRLMSPFPVVRIAGTALPHGALIKVLSVRSPFGARITLSCAGAGCPARSVSTVSDSRVVRFPRFERRLRAGTRLTLSVRQADRIGKYTSFLIRAGSPPRRADLCLPPGRRAPGRCP